MELIIMSLAGSLVALCLQLSESMGGGTAYAPAHISPGTGGRTGLWRGPAPLCWKTLFVLVVATLLEAFSSPAAASELQPAASLTQAPMVMRLSKDEFRLAFGITAVGCSTSGCHGAIRYRVNWRTEDGTARSDLREVDYRVLPHDARSITVDRQYFDTAEDAHTTEVLDVSVTRISCHTGAESRTLSADRTRRTQQPGRGENRSAADERSEVPEIPQQQ